jgi:hypothetical protein
MTHSSPKTKKVINKDRMQNIVIQSLHTNVKILNQDKRTK